MLSKPLLPWSKRQPGYETSPRTGGLLPTLKHRVSRFVLLPSDERQNTPSPTPTHYDTALASAVGNLHMAVNGMLKSRSSSVRGIPPRSRPRSTSVPLVVELPGEFPGLALLDRGQFSTTPVLTTSTVTSIHNESQQPKKQPVCDEAAQNASNSGAPQLFHSRSIRQRSCSCDLIRQTEASNARFTNETGQSGIQPEKRSRSFTALSILQRHLSSDATKSPAVGMRTDVVKGGSKICDQEAEMPKGHVEAKSPEPTLTAAHKERALRRSHSVQVTSFKTQPRLFKEETNKHSRQDVTSSGWLAGRLPDHSAYKNVHEGIELKPAKIETANTDTPPCYASVSQQQPLQQSPISSEKETLVDCTLFRTPELEATSPRRSSEPRPNEKDTVALQKQVDLLSAKLSNSSKNERELRNKLGTIKRESAGKAMHTHKLVERIEALHNTVKHLESRLEEANMKRLDAEEQLLFWPDHKSPFDHLLPEKPPSADTRKEARDVQITTGADTGSPSKATSTLEIGCLEETTPTALVALVKKLQTQIKKKDAYVADLETKLELLQGKHSQLRYEHKRVAAQVDLQHELLRERRTSDQLIEQLRITVIDHESTIMENEQTIYTLRRQLEHHKLLLQAEIRRRAAINLYAAAEEHPLPELSSLAKREDIDRWIEKLQKRLRREQLKNEAKAVADTPEAAIESLRHEIDFYIREIILFKLDIKGYKSDIRKLQETTMHHGSYQKLPDMETKSLSIKTITSPVESNFAPITPELDDFLSHADIESESDQRSIATLPLVPLFERRNVRAGNKPLELKMVQDFCNSKGSDSTNNVDRVDSAFVPSSNGVQVPQRSSSLRSLSYIHKRSMSAPTHSSYQQPVALGTPATGEKGTALRAQSNGASHRRINTSDASKLPLNLQPNLTELMNSHNSTQEVVPTSSGSYEKVVAYMASESSVRTRSEAGSVLSTASDYLAQPAPISQDALGNTIVLSVPAKASTESPPKLPYLAPPTPTHVQGCSITRCAPSLFQPGTGSTVFPPTPTRLTTPHMIPLRENVFTKAESSQNTPPPTPASGIDAGFGHCGEYLNIPHMLSELRRKSGSSTYSTESCQTMVPITKSEASTRLGMV